MTAAYLTTSTVAISGTTGQWVALISVLAVTVVVVVWMVRLARRSRK
jgi:hypothetical protein